MLLFGMINWMFTWLQPRRQLDHDAMAPVVADLFFGGLAAVRTPARVPARRRMPPDASRSPRPTLDQPETTSMKLLNRPRSPSAAVLRWPPALAQADIKVGVTVSATGPAASLGIPEKNTIALLPQDHRRPEDQLHRARRRAPTPPRPSATRAS